MGIYGQHGDYILHIAYLQIAKTVNLKSSHHKKKKCVTLYGSG